MNMTFRIRGPGSYALCSTLLGLWLFLSFAGCRIPLVWADSSGKIKGDFNFQDMKSKSGVFWIATTTGVLAWDSIQGGLTRFTVSEGLSDNQVNAVVIDDRGGIWFGTGNGVSRLKENIWTTFRKVDGLSGNRVYAATGDSRGNLWFGTDFGVSCYDGKTWKSYTSKDGLVHDSVRAIAEDHKGRLWFGTLRGVSMFDGFQWVNYSGKNGLGTDCIQSIAIDPKGNLWCAASILSLGKIWGRGVCRFDGTSWTRYSKEDGPGDDDITAAAVDSRGNLWFSAVSGISRFNGRGWRTFTLDDGTGKGPFSSIASDENGTPWALSDSGISRFNGSTWTHYPLERLGSATDNIGSAEDKVPFLLNQTDSHPYAIQIGTYQTQNAAWKVALKFTSIGDPTYSSAISGSETSDGFEVLYGSYGSLETANVMATRLKVRHFRHVVIVNRKYAVQITACSPANEIGILAKIENDSGYMPYTLPCKGETGMQRVLLGAFEEEALAEDLALTFKAKGWFKGAKVVVR